MLSELKLNLGCGANKLKGFVNIDINPDNNPDIVADFTKPLPYETNSVDLVCMFHTIEHVPKRLHQSIFYEVSRILKPNGKFLLSYPEFLKCVENYKNNLYGKRDFWEATIYGRQLYPSDTHVALMDTHFVVILLKSLGFHSLQVSEEPNESYNTLVAAQKGYALTHEQATSINLGFS